MLGLSLNYRSQHNATIELKQRIRKKLKNDKPWSNDDTTYTSPDDVTFTSPSDATYTSHSDATYGSPVDEDTFRNTRNAPSRSLAPIVTPYPRSWTDENETPSSASAISSVYQDQSPVLRTHQADTCQTPPQSTNARFTLPPLNTKTSGASKNSNDFRQSVNKPRRVARTPWTDTRNQCTSSFAFADKNRCPVSSQRRKAEWECDFDADDDQRINCDDTKNQHKIKSNHQKFRRPVKRRERQSRVADGGSRRKNSSSFHSMQPVSSSSSTDEVIRALAQEQEESLLESRDNHNNRDLRSTPEPTPRKMSRRHDDSDDDDVAYESLPWQYTSSTNAKKEAIFHGGTNRFMKN